MPNMRFQYFLTKRVHGTLRVRKLLCSNSFPSCILHRANTTMIGRNIEMLYIAWYATLRLLPLPIKLIRYTNVQIGAPDVAMSVEIRT